MMIAVNQARQENNMEIKNGMQFRFHSFFDSDAQGEVQFFLIAVPTGWLCQLSKDEFTVPQLYFVPDKEHLVNPYALWDDYSFGTLKDDHTTSPHQLEAYLEWKKAGLSQRQEYEFFYVPGDVKEGTITLRCPYCKKKHEHGWQPDYVLEHRQSHCKKKDPDNNGYYIFERTEVNEETDTEWK